MTISSIVVSLPYLTTTTLPDPILTNVVVLKVARSGKGHECILSAPGNREAKYNPGSATFDFLIPGVTGNPTNDIQPEKVYVRFKY